MDAGHLARLENADRGDQSQFEAMVDGVLDTSTKRLERLHSN